MRRLAIGSFVLAVIAAGSAGVACSHDDAAKQASVTSAPMAPSATPASDAGSAPTQAGPYNVLLLSIDSLRADDVPWAGYARPTAPRLAALAERAVVYTHAYAISSFTSKSLPGILSGRYPSELARNGVFFTRYLASNTMLCEALEPQGIPCVAGMAHAYLEAGKTGLDQGFRTWKLVPGITFDYQTDPYVTSQKLTPMAKEELADVAQAAGGKPFFAWFHYMDPHDQYQHHDGGPSFGERPRDRYDEEIAYTDKYIGELLDWAATQPWFAHTAVIVTADHGEAFGEHGRTRHAFELYEMLVRVPLFVVLPGAAPRRIDVPRSAIDLAPTIADLLGAKGPDGMHGTSLVPEVRGGDAPARDVVCDLPQDDLNLRRRALIHDGWKLIVFGNDDRFALYHIAVDPDEDVDLYWKDRDTAKAMLARYKDLAHTVSDVPPVGGIPTHDK